MFQNIKLYDLMVIISSKELEKAFEIRKTIWQMITALFLIHF